MDDEAGQRLQAQPAHERRLDAQRKRIRMLHDLVRELDLAVYMHLVAVYHLDCSFFCFAVRAALHCASLTPAADPAGERPPDEPKPFLPVVLACFAASVLLHQLHPAPSAGEDTRGFLHGGLLLDFVGQQGPASKWRLGALDLCILLLQLLMVAVHVKRRELKRSLAASASHDANADDEQRRVLRRSDALSDIGTDPEAEDALAPSSSDADRPDALDILTSGTGVIGDLTLFDTLYQENNSFAAYRLTRTESGISDFEPLRRLNTLRTRFGVGGG